MANAKYTALRLLWSPSLNRYIYPGEPIELDDDTALLLLKKQVIKPAEIRRKVKIKEVKHDADN